MATGRLAIAGLLLSVLFVTVMLYLTFSHDQLDRWINQEQLHQWKTQGPRQEIHQGLQRDTENLYTRHIKPPIVPRFTTKARATAGCFKKVQETKKSRIKLYCNRGVEMKEEFTLNAKRDNFYEVLVRKNAVCYLPELLGNPLDGGWWACKQKPFLLGRPCLVYSFGILDDWSFDEAMAMQYGCEVHSFDPSIGLEDHVHSDGVNFHNIGLGGKNEVKVVDGVEWKIRTFCTLLKELGHTGRIVDFLKFDAEYSEWAAMVSMLDEGCLSQVKQIATEVHAWSDTEANYTLFWRGMHGLENFGFQKWKVVNKGPCFRRHEKKYCQQCDMHYVNVRYMLPGDVVHEYFPS